MENMKGKMNDNISKWTWLNGTGIIVTLGYIGTFNNPLFSHPPFRISCFLFILGLLFSLIKIKKWPPLFKSLGIIFFVSGILFGLYDFIGKAVGQFFENQPMSAQMSANVELKNTVVK